jgi:proteasome lid subunit RPN8/RPN11
MIRIAWQPWNAMVAHARSAYPNECCGAMLGSSEDGVKQVREAIPLENAFAGEQRTRYELRPESLLAADRAARQRQMELIGIYHSHPDCDAYFSETDLKNSCPWYSFVVLSVRNGEFVHANCWLPDAAQTIATQEELIVEPGPATLPPHAAVDCRRPESENPHA